MRLNLRDGDDGADQVLITKFKGKKWNKNNKQPGKDSWSKGKSNGKYENGYSSNKKKFGSSNKKDKFKIQCYRCDKYGHNATKCSTRKDKKEKKTEGEANVAKQDTDSDSRPVVFSMISNVIGEIEPKEDSIITNVTPDENSEYVALVITISNDKNITEIWYLDSACSNHLT